MKTLQKTIIATAAFGLMSGMATLASAASVTEVTANALGERAQIVVSFADLNLASVEGQEALQYRISHAAEKVCGSNDTRRAGGVAQAARNEACYDNALSQALSEVMGSAVASIN